MPLDPQNFRELATLLTRAMSGLSRVSELASAVGADMAAAGQVIGDLVDDLEADRSAGFDN